MAAITFPAPTQLKNLLDPTDTTDAATKEYVDNSFNAITNLSVANLTSTNKITANVIVANSVSGNGSQLSNITGANINGSVANANYANYAGTAFSVSVANVVGIGNIATLNLTGSSTDILYGNGTFAPILAANANYANYAGNVVNSSQPNITSVGTLVNLSVTGNISAGNVAGGNLVSANFHSGNGSLLTSITGANVTGQVSNALVAGTVYSATQSNITSVGTLTSITVSGKSNLNAVGNITITGGSNGQYLTTDGTGNLSFTTPSQLTSAVDNFTGDGTTTIFSLSATPGNVDYTFVSIGGVMQPRSYYSVSGSSLTFTTAPPAASIVEITILGGSVTGQTANANYANFAGNVVNSAQPNITSVGTLTSLNAVLPQVSNVTNASGIVTYNPSNNQLSYGPQSWFQGGLSSAITPTTSTDYVILWNNNNDPIGMGNTSTGHVVPGRTGWYMVTLRLTLSTNGSGATGQVNSQIRVNNAQELFSQCTSNHAQYNGFTFMNTGMVYLSSITDYITTTVYVTTSGQQISGGSSSSLVVQWISN